jgi:hypothetical protein
MTGQQNVSPSTVGLQFRHRLLPVIFLLLFFANPAQATTHVVDLSYKIYVGGFQVASLKINMDLETSNYDIAAKVETTGLVGRMFPWWMRAYSRGDLVGANVKPAVAGQKNNWRGRERFIDIKFTDGVARIDRIAPKPEYDDRDRVPEEMRVGALDLASAIILIIRRMDSAEPCHFKVPVFDGRRRYDLMSVPGGSGRLKPSGYTPYVGETVNCILSVQKKAGFKKNDDSGWNDKGRAARVWMGKAFRGVPYVPVRVTLNTPVGDLMAHLTAATSNSGGELTRLGR